MMLRILQDGRTIGSAPITLDDCATAEIVLRRLWPRIAGRKVAVVDAGKLSFIVTPPSGDREQ